MGPEHWYSCCSAWHLGAVGRNQFVPLLGEIRSLFWVNVQVKRLKLGFCDSRNCGIGSPLVGQSVPSKEKAKMYAPGRWGTWVENGTNCGQPEGGAEPPCSKKERHVEEGATFLTILGIENQVPWCIINAKHEGT